MPLLPNNQPQLLASDIIKRTDQLVARDNGDGGLKDSTKIGIAIGLSTSAQRSYLSDSVLIVAVHSLLLWLDNQLLVYMASALVPSYPTK